MTSAAGGNTTRSNDAATSSASSLESQSEKTQSQTAGAWNQIVKIVNWQPPWTRWDPEHPPVFSLPMNILFGFAGAFTVANLYYSHPILNILASDFGVSYEQVSQIPTLAQSGYAVGLLFLCPCGDIFRRRSFVLLLVWFTSTLWIGLPLTNNLSVFSAITFLTAITTVTPQLMLPLVGDLAPPHRRAQALSIVTAGNLLGILIARLLSGIVATYTSWRNIYWIAFGLQYLILILLWLFMPDYPSTNPGGLNYFSMLWSMTAMLKKHPVLVQASLIGLCNMVPFTQYWTTLTFLLADPPYNYDSVIIGLFALIGIAGIVITPLFSRRVIDHFVPLFSVLLGSLIALTGIIIGTYTGNHSVAGPCIQAFLLDLGLQTSQIANRSSIYACEPNARNRVNTAYMVFTFLGQITGTSAGARVYALRGWVGAGSLSVGFMGLSCCVALSRGPWEKGWIGWHGGASMRKKDKMSADGFTGEKAMHTKEARLASEGRAMDSKDDEESARPMGVVERGLEEKAGEDGENPVRRANDERDGNVE